MQALIALSLLAHLSTPADSEPACYVLRAGEWSGIRARQPVPTRVRLDTLPKLGGFFRLASEEGPRLGMAGWRRVGADLIQLVWSDGFEGVVVLARVHGDSLSGQARRETDVVVDGAAESAAEVQGARVPCRNAPAR
jgi:hypothetical protein